MHVPKSMPTIKLITYGKELTGDTPSPDKTDKDTPIAHNNNPMPYINNFLLQCTAVFISIFLAYMTILYNTPWAIVYDISMHFVAYRKKYFPYAHTTYMHNSQ